MKTSDETEIPPVGVGSQCYVSDVGYVPADPMRVTVLWADEERMFVSQVDTVNSFHIVKRERVLTPEQVARHEIHLAKRALRDDLEECFDMAAIQAAHAVLVGGKHE